ncbi:hypothetical protein EHO60_15995 [Leptospira fletcheri]|uniref:Dolichyl-phosphate-mannose--protein mannosyltransferase n=1 Tax=Leptospira fletcheri TaxID=2484981 RepID=A0A4R9G519_9LEPT|nr:hypothetical protein [Leptospira fletcheri]TGK06524.1 hypothetical protein EHO60_15995 [Leptospira fletcheri]
MFWSVFLRRFSIPKFLTVVSAAIFCTALVSVGGTPSLADDFYNSDSLFFPILYSELFLKGGSLGFYPIGDWCWTPSPYFFPDLAAYFALRTLFLPFPGAAWEATHLSYAFLQWTFLLAGIPVLFRVLRKEPNRNGFEFVFLSFGYLLGASFLFLGEKLFLFLPGYHGGTWASLSWVWACHFSWKKTGERTYFYGTILAVFLLSLSDLFFVPVFVIPLTITETYEFLFKNRGLQRLRKFWFSFLPTATGLILAKILLNILDKNKIILFPGSYASGKVGWSVLFGNPKVWWNDFTVASGGLFGSNRTEISIVAFVFVVSLFRNRIRFPTGVPEKTSRVPVLLFASLGFLSPLFLVLLAAINGHVMENGNPIDRYFGQITVAVLGCGFWLLGSMEFERKFRLGLFAFLCFGTALLVTVAFSKNSNPVYYPERMQCIDRLITEKGYRRGISNFWISRPMRVFSRSEAVIDDYLPDLNLFYWQNTFAWFLSDVPYTFAVMEGIDETALKSVFRDAKPVADCGSWKIYDLSDPDGEKSKALISSNRNKIGIWKGSRSK